MRVPIVVVGGGHAGCEAAAAAARSGVETLLITTEPDHLGKMSCNPAIGGIGKGHLVREIDALGGLMGRLADAAAIQYKVLNRKKGPAVWGLRAQEDRRLYSDAARRAMSRVAGLETRRGTVTGVMIRGGRVIGITVDTLGEIEIQALVIATGTFLNGVIHLGPEIIAGGRVGEPPTTGISETLVRAGLHAARFKTGTPPRVDGKTVDTSRCHEEWGDDTAVPFSSFGPPSVLPKRPCWLTATTPKTHEVVRKHIDEAPLYTGQIQAVGPRSCPSVEDKVMRFPERSSHHIFIEPEGLDTEERYLNGLSTSFPREIQEEIVASVPGLEDARITRYGYAIEYDYFPPQQLRATLETKRIKGLYLAGQINGTTGYEEAAALGLMAGINAALAVKREEPLVLRRTQAYIGVMVDDLILRGVEFPYRIYTSRAESRLFLRNDNADIRLSGIAHSLGLLCRADYERVLAKERAIAALMKGLRVTRWSVEKLETIFGPRGERFHESQALDTVLKRPAVTMEDLWENGLEKAIGPVEGSARRETELMVKYEGYVRRCESAAGKLDELDSIRIPVSLNFQTLQNMRLLSRERLDAIRPETLGQVARVPGITANDISVISIAIERMRRENRNKNTSQ